MRIPLATNLKVRTGNPDKDARLKNSYVEVRGDQSAVRKRPIARGGIATGTGTPQGGIGFSIGDTDYFVGFWGDDSFTVTDADGTTWDVSTTYSTGDHVSYGWVDYWSVGDGNVGNDPTTSPDDWSETYIKGTVKTYATWGQVDNFTLSGGNLTATCPSSPATVLSTIGVSSGKWYWEVTGDSVVGDAIIVSVASDISTLLDGLPLTTGVVAGLALDADADPKVIHFYANGVFIATVSGAYATNYAYGFAVNASGSITANFGATPFTYSAPEGYNSGLYTES